MRTAAIWVVLLSQLAVAAAASVPQADSSASPPTAYCNFDDGNQVSMQYNDADLSNKEQPRAGKVWAPGGAPMVLYAQTAMTLAGTAIPVGAYTVYVIPNKKDWTLIVNRNVKAGSAYDQTQDLTRASMELGEIGESTKQLQVSFGHLGPKQCNLRLYYQKTGAFVDFMEK